MKPINRLKILAIGDFHGKMPAKLKARIRKTKPDLILSTGDYAAIEELRPYITAHFKAIAKGKRLNLKEVIGRKKFSKLIKKDYAAGKKILKEFDKLGVKIISVFGNGDWYRFEYNKSNRDYALLIKKLKNIKNINRGKATFQGLKIAGFGGYLDPDIYLTKKGIRLLHYSRKHIRIIRKSYKKEEKRLMKIMKNKPDILLTHYTPYRCMDKMKMKGMPLHGSYMGISYFNKAIKKYQPSLVICGHMHEYQGKCKIGKTTVINPGAAYKGKAALIELEREKIKKVKFIK